MTRSNTIDRPSLAREKRAFAASAIVAALLTLALAGPSALTPPGRGATKSAPRPTPTATPRATRKATPIPVRVNPAPTERPDGDKGGDGDKGKGKGKGGDEEGGDG